MLRSRSELIEMERLLSESISCKNEAFRKAVKEKSPCAKEATERLLADEEELRTLMQFKDFSAKVVEGALAETEDKFFPDLAEVLIHQKSSALNLDVLMDEREIEKALSPTLAYDKFGEAKLPASANTARIRANLLWHRKSILEWLLKQAESK